MNPWDDCARLIIRYAFIGKPIGPEKLFNQMVETLGIIIDKPPKGSSRKMEN
jgi:hypothetical protein